MYIEFSGHDTFVRQSDAGEYDHKLWMRHDVTDTLSIGNSPYQEGGRNWKSGDVWSDERTLRLPDPPKRPLTVVLPYPKPTLKQLLEWSQTSYVGFKGEMNQLGLKPVRTSHSDIGLLWSANPYEFHFAYDLERQKSNFIVISYGVYGTDYPSELEWAKGIGLLLKGKVKDYYEGKWAIENLNSINSSIKMSVIPYIFMKTSNAPVLPKIPTSLGSI